jgi:hypothetical protein
MNQQSRNVTESIRVEREIKPPELDDLTENATHSKTERQEYD